MEWPEKEMLVVRDCIWLNPRLSPFGQVNKEMAAAAIYQRHYASKKVRFLAIVKGGPSLASSDRGAETRNDDDEGKDDSAEKRPKIF